MYSRKKNTCLCTIIYTNSHKLEKGGSLPNSYYEAITLWPDKISQEKKTTENSLHKPEPRNQNWQVKSSHI